MYILLDLLLIVALALLPGAQNATGPSWRMTCPAQLIVTRENGSLWYSCGGDIDPPEYQCRQKALVAPTTGGILVICGGSPW